MENAKREQKFTDWKDVVSEKYHSFIESNPTRDDIDTLSVSENEEVLQQISRALNSCTQSAVDILYSKLEKVLSKDSKREQWQRNHSLIMREVHNHMVEENRMLTKTEIASITGLSRTTVHKHLSNLSDDSFYREEIDQYKALVPKVLMYLYKNGLKGDTNSFKLFLRMMGVNENPTTQNNFIQINNTTITESTFQKLDPSKQQLIESWFSEVEEENEY